MPPPDALQRLIERELEAHSHRDDPDVARLIEAMRQRHGRSVACVLLYGSYLRGKRDTLLDFYVLLDGLHPALPSAQALGNRLLPPNVYYLSLPADAAGSVLRAKYATMTLDQFSRGMQRFHGYFWSRFTQPTGLVFARDAATLERVTHALACAVDTFVQRTLPMLPERFSAAELWCRGLSLTYASELRAESAAGIDAVYRHHEQHFDALLAAYAAGSDAALHCQADGAYQAVQPPAGRAAARLVWGVRKVQGKVLSVLRLVKAAGTFNDPLDYLLWKIERHSGVYLAPTERQRRHPLIFAWPLLWRLYRRGAFR